MAISVAEAGAYKYLFEHNLTGGMQLVPEYYGCWATKFVVGKNEDGSSKFRCVGLILMEYLYGASIKEICDRDEDYEFLVPEKGGMIYASPEETEDEKSGPKVNLALRKAVIRMVIRGIVLHSHVGVKTVFVLPENIFVTACKDPLGNLVPRAVMLDYSITEVHSKTKDATDPDCYPEDDLELPPHPIHPLERFNAGMLEQFYGWYPLTGLKWSEKRQAYCGKEFDEKGEFIKWLTDEFGPLVEGQNDKGEYY